MPASEFETALTERIEFAVFVAYEQWVRASNYAAHNPYDLLARMLPGLVADVGEAAARRGGWGAFDPAAGDAAGHPLIHEMAAQAVASRLGSLAPDAPEPVLLAQVVTDAVSRAVTGFVDDPESWRFSLIPGETGPTTLSGRLTREGQPSDLSPIPPEDEAGALDGADAPAAGQPANVPGAMDEVAEQWFAKLGSGSFVTAIALDSAFNLFVYLDIDAGAGNGGSGNGGAGSDGSDLEPGVAPADPPDLGGDRGGNGGTLPPFFLDNPAALSALDAFATMPPAVAQFVLDFIERAGEGDVVLVGRDGSQFRLTGNTAREFVDTLNQVLQQTAAGTPAIEQPAPPPPAPDQPPHLVDMSPVAGPHSDTLLVPSSDVVAVPSEDSVVLVAVTDDTGSPAPQTPSNEPEILIIAEVAPPPGLPPPDPLLF